MWLSAVYCVMLAISHRMFGSGLKSFKETDTGLGVVSTLQVGRLRGHVSIRGANKKLLYSRIDQYGN